MVALASKKLLKTEAGLPPIERLLVTTLWGLKRLNKYSGFLPAVTVALPHPAEVAVCHAKNLPLRIQAKLIELSSYRAEFTWGQGAITIGDELGAALSDPPGSDVEGLEQPQWEHSDRTIVMPGRLPQG